MKRIMVALLLTISGSTGWAQTPTGAAATGSPRPDDGPAGLTYGNYRYDPSGNIVAIGNNYYVYDALGRVKTAGVQYEGFVQERTYTYDVYGNRLTDGSNNFPANAQNRYTGATYDTAGNMTSWQPPGASGTRTYDYDALDHITRETADLPTNDRWLVHIYTADDERLWTYHDDGLSYWTIRDLGGNVQREYRTDAVTWTVHRDYVYRSGQLLAARTPAGTHHYSLDHLGTPRVVTDNAAVVIGEHSYWPFGTELTGGSQPREGFLRFTGHERDKDVGDATDDGMDYMHARYYGPDLGRFSSVDTMPSRGHLPQSWNRYSYAINNPVRFVDPNGLYFVAATEADRQYFAAAIAGGTGNRAARQAFLMLAQDNRPIYLRRRSLGNRPGSNVTGGTLETLPVPNAASPTAAILSVDPAAYTHPNAPWYLNSTVTMFHEIWHTIDFFFLRGWAYAMFGDNTSPTRMSVFETLGTRAAYYADYPEGSMNPAEVSRYIQLMSPPWILVESWQMDPHLLLYSTNAWWDGVYVGGMSSPRY